MKENIIINIGDMKMEVMKFVKCNKLGLIVLVWTLVSFAVIFYIELR